MSDPAHSRLISSLNQTELSRLVYRLDHNTSCGLLTAINIAKLRFGDMTLLEVFKKVDCSAHQAKILARKVVCA